MRDTLDEFNVFHNSNPKVYIAFAKIARRELKKLKPPYKRGSLKAMAIVKEIRGNRRIRTTTMRQAHGRKIDNNHAAYYARLFMQKNPEFKGVFAVRTIKSSEKAVTLFGEKGTGYISKRSDHY